MKEPLTYKEKEKNQYSYDRRFLGMKTNKNPLDRAEVVEIVSEMLKDHKTLATCSIIISLLALLVSFLTLLFAPLLYLLLRRYPTQTLFAALVIDMVYESYVEEDEDEEECCCGHHHEEGEECECGHHHHHDEEDDEEEDAESDEELREAEDRFFEDIAGKKSRITPSLDVNDEAFAATEASRCMECSYLCLKCVDVCPNRANVAIDLRETGLFEDPYQVLHVDAYCNECGNCASFCPHSGRPYRDKFSLFSLREDFDGSSNSGFIAENDEVTIRLDGRIIKGRIGKDGTLEADVPDEIRAIIEEVFLSYPYLLGTVEE